MIKLFNEGSSTQLKKALFGDYSGKIKTFQIVSAENPMGKSATTEYNNKQTSKLKNQLKRMNLQYIPIYGMFDNVEHSFLIINLSRNDAINIANIFKQLSFFYGVNRFSETTRHNSSIIDYYQKSNIDDEDSSYEIVETSDRIDTLNDADNYFSRHGDFKYSINMKVFGGEGGYLSDLKEVLDEDSLNKSIDDKYTPYTRMSIRYKIYK